MGENQTMEENHEGQRHVRRELLSRIQSQYDSSQRAENMDP
jgi:hypothetical protein